MIDAYLLLSGLTTGVILGSAGAVAAHIASPRAFRGRLYRVLPGPDPGDPVLFYTTLHGLLRGWPQRLLRGQPPVSLEYVAQAGGASMQIFVPREIEHAVIRMLRTSFPGARLVPVEGDDGRDALIGRFALRRRSLYPIQIDPRSDMQLPLLAVLGEPRQDERLELQFVIAPHPSSWSTNARIRASLFRTGERRSDLWRALSGGLPTRRASHFEIYDAQAIEEKADGLPFEAQVRVRVQARTQSRRRVLVRDVVAALRPFAGRNSFEYRRVLATGTVTKQFATRQLSLLGRFILTNRELAGIWKVPERIPAHLNAVRTTSLAVPPAIPTVGRIFGVSTHDGDDRPVAQPLRDALLHAQIAGPPGSGKSHLQLNLALQALASGLGLAVFDPKSDLVQDLLERMPDDRTDDIVLVTPGTDRAVGFNPLEHHGGEPERLADNLVSAFKRVVPTTWGPRTEEILRSCLLTLVGVPGMTLAHIPRILTDQDFRSQLLAQIDDPLGAASFWRYYASMSESQRLEAVGPLINRLRAFLALPAVRRILCQPRSTIDLGQILRGRWVILINLDSAAWGETTARLVGSMIFGSLYTAARTRLSMPAADRRDFHIYVDEFAHFVGGVSESFADVLAQARGLGVGLTLAHQNLGQLDPSLREAVVANARTRVIFQCGPDDARAFAREMLPLSAADLMNLPRFEAAVRLATDGSTSPTFTIRTLPSVASLGRDRAAAIRRRSAERWGRPVAEVDAELREMLGSNPPPTPSAGVGRRRAS